MSTGYSVKLKVTLAQPLTSQEQTKRMMAGLTAADYRKNDVLTNMFKPQPPNEYCFEMKYASLQACQHDWKYQFFNEARAHFRDLQVVAHTNRIVAITFVTR